MIMPMHYKVIDTELSFQNQSLFVNNKPIELKQATYKTLELFIQSRGKIISKDDILDHVWESVIVSDASIFKQVELIRKLFKQAGLPKDAIKNVYGKGYKIKYEITKIDEPVIKLNRNINETKQEKKPILKYSIIVFSILVLAIILVYFGLLNQSPKPNFLNNEQRKSMIALMNNDWKDGLQNINTSIDNHKNELSNDDLAFLLGNKGEAQYHLQEYENSIDSYGKALKLYNKTNGKKQAGQIHLKISTSLNMLPQSKESYTTQLKHINAAIELFQQSDSTIEMIDAQMVLAHLYQKNNKIDQAITLFEKTIVDANNINDTTGAMMANNNLAAAHLILNHYDKAIELGQKGLDMALKIGKSRYIANSYSFLSNLYQNQYRSVEAMEMIEQAIKRQLSTQEFSYLSPKLMNLDFLLVQTYQFDKAKELLILSEKYAKFLKMKNGVSIISLYKGLNAARQNNWREAEEHLTQALKISQRQNFKYKQPLTKAYLALAHFFNNNNLQAIEIANQVLNTDESDKQSKAIAALSLAYVYTYIEKTELADKWFQKVQNLQNPKWLFEYQLFLKLKLERQNDSILAIQTQKEIEDVQKAMIELSKSSKVNEEIYQNLVIQITEKIQTNSE